MEKEYIIAEHEVGIRFVDGKFEDILKPGKYKFGVHGKDIKESIQKALTSKEDFMEDNYSELTHVNPMLRLIIRGYERKMKKFDSISRRLRKAMIEKIGAVTLTNEEEMTELKEKLRKSKINAYNHDLEKIPAKIREKLIEMDKNIEESGKEPMINVQTVDTRQLTLTVQGQEMLTHDKVSIRINILAQYRVKDFKKAALSVVSYQDRLYQQIQMVVRDYASANTLDQLLTNKNTISKYVREKVKDLATSIGLELIEVGLKDIILPGEIKEAMNQVVEAERSGKASFIKAREEVAAARAMANAAKIMNTDPNVMRLKQMETLKEVAKSPATTIYFGIGEDVAKSMKIGK